MLLKQILLFPVGEIDLEMLSVLHSKHPGVAVDNEVVEPSAEQLYKYKGRMFRGTCILKVKF